MVRHGHGAKSRTGHVRKIARTDISDSHCPDCQVDAADADFCSCRQAEALSPLCRDLADDRARQDDLRELFLPDPEIFHHL